MNLKPVNKFCAYAFVIGVFFFIIFIVLPPNFAGGGPDKLLSVVNTLRQIEAAKSEWAYENGYTNASDVLRQATPQEIAPYANHNSIDKFGFGFDQNGIADTNNGVIFLINALTTSPQANFIRDFTENRWRHGQKIPRGTIMVLSNTAAKFILPGQTNIVFLDGVVGP